MTDKEAWGYVQGVGFGKIYLEIDPEKIYPKAEIETKVDEFRKGVGLTFSHDTFLRFERVNVKGAIISGSLGTGKTSILSYLAFKIIKEFSVKGDGFEEWHIPPMNFISTGELFDLFFEKEKERIDALRSSNCLFLDDWGREYQTDFPLSKFENFIEYRYANLHTTLITTNIAPVDLPKNPKWSRIVDRFRDKKWMDIIEIKGKSMRG